VAIQVNLLDVGVAQDVQIGCILMQMRSGGGDAVSAILSAQDVHLADEGALREVRSTAVAHLLHAGANRCAELVVGYVIIDYHGSTNAMISGRIAWTSGT